MPSLAVSFAARLLGTFDSFNMVVAGVKGDLAEGIELIYDPLMASSLDEAASVYGLIAEAARYPADFSWVSFRLRAQARWHDGRPITPEDVLFSLKAFRTFHPQLSVYYRHVVHAEKTGDREVKFHFDVPGIRELPQVMAQLLVLPRHWWQGKDEAGNRRDVSKTTLEPPLGSGPYRICTIRIRSLRALREDRRLLGESSARQRWDQQFSATAI